MTGFELLITATISMCMYMYEIKQYRNNEVKTCLDSTKRENRNNEAKT